MLHIYYMLIFYSLHSRAMYLLYYMYIAVFFLSPCYTLLHLCSFAAASLSFSVHSPRRLHWSNCSVHVTHFYSFKDVSFFNYCLQIFSVQSLISQLALEIHSYLCILTCDRNTSLWRLSPRVLIFGFILGRCCSF